VPTEAFPIMIGNGKQNPLSVFNRNQAKCDTFSNGLVFSPSRLVKGVLSVANTESNQCNGGLLGGSTTPNSNTSIYSKKRNMRDITNSPCNIEGLESSEKQIAEENHLVTDNYPSVYVKRTRISNMIEKEAASLIPDAKSKEEQKSMQVELQRLREEVFELRKKNIDLENTLEKTNRQCESLQNALDSQRNAKESLLEDLMSRSRHRVHLELERNCALREWKRSKLECEQLMTRDQENNEKILKANEFNENITKVTKDLQSKISHEEKNINKLKERFFFSCAIALKLSNQLFLQKSNQSTDNFHMNIDLNALYEEAILQNIPFEEWHSWLNQKLSSMKSHEKIKAK